MPFRRCKGALFFDTDRNGGLHERTIDCGEEAAEGHDRCSGCLMISRREMRAHMDRNQQNIRKIFDVLEAIDERQER